MIMLLDTIGSAVWRASWQAVVLALLVAIVVRCCGERLSPRWCFLLWAIVLARLVCVPIPGSPWSMFNLVRWEGETNVGTMASAADGKHTPEPPKSTSTTSVKDTNAESPPIVSTATESPLPKVTATPTTPPSAGETGPIPTRSIKNVFKLGLVTRVLSSIWLAGCLVFALKLMATTMVLRRRLSACRAVRDPAILNRLETFCRRLRLRRSPAVVVTPESLSPCIVGTWQPRIVLPESLLTEARSARLDHVLAHELSHLVRGDLWTNWLLLAARIVHWFNPVAWWTVREMQAHREAACDELAFAVLGEGERSAYAVTIVDLAAGLSPSALAPGMIGLFSSNRRLRGRVERLLRSPSTPALRAPIATGLLLAMALLGLTDAMPRAKAQVPKKAAATQSKEPKADTYTFSGTCVDSPGDSAAAGVMVRLYRAAGPTSPPVEITKTLTDRQGRFAFSGLAPPRREHHLDYLDYSAFAFPKGRPIGIGFHHFEGTEMITTIRLARETSTLSGKVIDTRGRGIEGATVMRYYVGARPIGSLGSATTDIDGRFKFGGVPVYKTPDGRAWGTTFTVLHPDHPETMTTASTLPADLVVTLPDGCLVTGTVTDKVSEKPAAGAVVTARRVDEWGESFAATDAEGRFRLLVLEGRYDFLVGAKDRVSIGLTGRECLTAEKVDLPPLVLIGGGFISGQVINTATRQPVNLSESREPIMLGLIGPSQPMGAVISPARLAEVDKTGRFTLRAAPGENFPYFVNTRGNRMAWDTQNQPPVIVKDGETTAYDMLITPEVPPEEKLKAARKLVEALPKKPAERTSQIILEFRKLNRTVDETELWCLLMRELVAIGSDAVPQLCAELDDTTENKMLRRLGFALRAIGDPRAVPALIRAIPKTLLPPGSDYGLIVADKELADFMQTHDLGPGNGGTYFSFGRPTPEIVGALHRLTGQTFSDADLHLSEDPRRQVLQRRLYSRHAQRWQEWWEANWRTFSDDVAYQKVNLRVVDEPLPPANQTLGKSARLSGEIAGAVLSPAIEHGRYASHFYDLDTGHQPGWPEQIPQDETALDDKQLVEWASENGVDLMCLTHHSPDGRDTYVLRAFGMKIVEIDSRELRNLDRLIAEGTLPEGRPVGELLMHYDDKSQRLVPDANAAFVYITREGNMGLIETTDRVTRTADLTGAAAGGAPAGVGFHRGVRFNLKAIIP